MKRTRSSCRKKKEPPSRIKSRICKCDLQRNSLVLSRKTKLDTCSSSPAFFFLPFRNYRGKGQTSSLAVKGNAETSSWKSALINCPDDDDAPLSLSFSDDGRVPFSFCSAQDGGFLVMATNYTRCWCWISTGETENFCLLILCGCCVFEFSGVF